MMPLLRTASLTATAAWLAVIAWLSLTSGPPSGPSVGAGSFFVNQYTAHLGMYGVLGGLAMLGSWSLPLSGNRGRTGLAIVLVAGAYGGLMELLQASTPERSMSAGDALLNLLGAAIAVTAMERLRPAARRWARGRR